MIGWRGASRRRQMFYAVLGVLVLVIAGVVIGVRLAGGSADPSGPPAQSDPGPVLLVPGYGGNASSLTTLAGRLRAAGRTADIVRLPGDGRGDLLAQVATLDKAVDDALAAGAPSVDVVGYSAGGLVTRLWVARDDGGNKARRVVTLGSPLHGTQLAAQGTALLPGECPLACQQLVPGSPLLRSVETQPLPAGLRWLSLWTRDDQTVTPPDSARLAGAVNVPLQQVCPAVRVSHSDLPRAPVVVGIVLGALDGPALTAPTKAVC
ncbi:MAG TPA: lipase [Pseudonocardiaceae bacterium]|nr:lipase [Pseudonocardiaceae bacterium]